MESAHGTGIPSEQLIGVVRGVRNRYRAKRALRGAAITVAASWVILAVAAYAMNALKYSDGAVLAIRVVSLLAIAAAAVLFILLPLRPKFGDDQVAMYLEEHEHSLKASVITAVEMQRGGPANTGVMRSPALIERLTRAALDRVHKANDGRAIDAMEASPAVVARLSLYTIHSCDASPSRSPFSSVLISKATASSCRPASASEITCAADAIQSELSPRYSSSNRRSRSSETNASAYRPSWLANSARLASKSARIFA